MSKPRGFAAMTPEERKRIATMGGKASQASGKAHRWSAEEARRNGRIGGLSSTRNHSAEDKAGSKECGGD